MNRKKTLLAASALAASAAGFAPVAGAVDEVNVARGLSIVGAPLALHGYDPVAYFTQGKPVRGQDSITVVHEGAAYRFSNAEHQKLFKADPARYAPQFGGYCAFGVAIEKKFDGDPLMWTVRNDRLYLNLNPEIQATFSKDVPGNIGKAEKNWSRIKSKAVADL